MELVQIMKPLTELEYQMHRLYMWFSDCYGNNETHRLFFREIAREELQHRDMVKKQRDLLIKSFREFRDIDADIQGIHQLTGILKDIADKREKKPLAEALDVAIQIEQSAVERHYRFLIAKANPVLKEMVDVLVKADRVHVQRLLDFRKQL